MRPLSDVVLALPKVEQHLHLEAALTTHLAKRLAARNGVTIPDALLGDDENFVCQDYHHFQEVYDHVANVIKTEQDYVDITYDYLRRSHAEGVIYSELFLSSQHAEMNQVSYEAMLAGCVTGIERAKRDFGIESRLIMVLVRHFGLDAVNQTVEKIIAHPHPLVVGVTTAGDELQLSPTDLKPAYQKLKQAGLKLTLHVGEICGPERVREALEILPLDRIGHGIRSIEDPELVQALVAREMTLEICLTSNSFLGFFDDYADHPLLKFIEAGVKVTLSSDDPTFFATTIGREYQIAYDLGVDEQTLQAITRQAIVSGFMDETTRQVLLKKLPVAETC